MSQVRRRDTGPERDLRRELYRRGRRFRVDTAPLAEMHGRADVLFTRARLAVYVDGCFWHACPEHATWPRANGQFWDAKLNRNRERDRETNRRLREAGWEVVRVWEHEDASSAADRIEMVLNARIPPRGID